MTLLKTCHLLPTSGMLMPEACHDSLLSRNRFGWDIETLPKPGFAFTRENHLHPSTARIEWMSVATDDGAWDWEIPIGSDPFQDIGVFLNDVSKTCVIWNVGFEFVFCRHYMGNYPKCSVIDAMLALHLFDEKRYSYELKVCAPEFLGMEMIKYEDASRIRSSVLPEERSRWNKYCQDDAIGALRMAEYLIPKLRNQGLLEYFMCVVMPLAPVLAEGRYIGTRVDLSILDRRLLEIYNPKTGKGELTDLADKIYALAGCRINLGSSRQLSDLLFKKLGYSPLQFKSKFSAKSGQFGTDAKVLAAMQRDGVQIATHIDSHRKLSKQFTGTFKPLVARLKSHSTRHGIIYFGGKQHRQKSGRLSYGPVSVNTVFPRPNKSIARKAVIPREGMVLGVCDLNQAELRVMAHASGDPELQQCYMPGTSVDVHTKTAVATGLQSKGKAGRNTAKGINFGSLYLMGPATLAMTLLKEQGIVISIDEARRFLKIFFETFPGVREFQEDIKGQIEANGVVYTIFGRPRRLEEGRRHCPFHIWSSGVNHPIQGTVADLMQVAMREIYIKATERGIWGPEKFSILFQVHDELVFQCPEDIGSECLELVKTEMENSPIHKIGTWGGYPLAVPLIAEGKLVSNWWDGK